MRFTFKDGRGVYMIFSTILLAGSFQLAAPAWVAVTSTFSGANLSRVGAVPHADKVVLDDNCSGLWATTNGGSSWGRLGGAAGINVTNEGTFLVFDPSDPNTFWECGIYGGSNTNCNGWGPGVFRTNDGGNSFVALGGIVHNDGMSVDFSDPLRRTVLACVHETPAGVTKSIDGGISSFPIDSKFPAGFGAATDCWIINSQTYIVACSNYKGTAGLFRTTDGGSSWTQVSTQTVKAAGGIACIRSGTLFAALSQAGMLLKGSSDGAAWTTLTVAGSSGLPTDVPGGKIALVGSNAILLSADDGATWQPVAPNPPGKSGVTYNSVRGAFFCWQSGSGVWRYDTLILAGLDVNGLQCSPASISQDKSNSIAVSVHASTSTGTVSGVTIDLSSLGGGTTVAMTAAGGDLFTCSYTVPAGIGAGTRGIIATATDNASNQASVGGGIVVGGPAPAGYLHLYCDTSAVQATFGWYGNGKADTTHATDGLSVKEVSTGGSEGTKCLDFHFAIVSWWAGFDLSWNNNTYIANGTGFDSICFDYKMATNCMFGLNLKLPGNKATDSASMTFGGSGGWIHASIPLSFYSVPNFRNAGYPIDSIMGLAITMKGLDATNPVSADLYLDDIYMVAATPASVLPGNRFRHNPAAGMTMSGMSRTVFDIRGRQVSGKTGVSGSGVRAGAGLYLFRMTNGTVVRGVNRW